MLVGITGAHLKRDENFYKVIYKEHIIFESKTGALALCVALSKKECENLLTSILKSV